MALWLVGIMVMGCAPRPDPIRYGQDACTYCRMTIVDQRYGSELVTDKAKVYKFDAIECMINYMHAHPDITFAHTLVTHFNHPGELVDAHTSIYLITPKLPSPMRADINAFADRPTADSFRRRYGGKIYTWEELLQMDFRRSAGRSM